MYYKSCFNVKGFCPSFVNFNSKVLNLLNFLVILPPEEGGFVYINPVNISTTTYRNMNSYAGRNFQPTYSPVLPDAVSFSGFNLKNYNPAYKFGFRFLFESSQINSRKRFSPTISGMEGKLKEVFIPLNNKAKDKIVAYDINPDNTDKYIIFFHGSSQNISNCQRIYKEILESKFAVLAPEYSGYGKNKPIKADESTLNADIDAALKYLKDKGIKPQNIGVVGHSFGGYAAVSAVAKEPDAAFAVLISPLNSFRYEVENVMKSKRFKMPKAFLYAYKMFPNMLKPLENMLKTEERISKSNVPFYIIHSVNDNWIPVKSSQSLASRAKLLKKLIILEKGGHHVDDGKLDVLKEILEKLNVQT